MRQRVDCLRSVVGCTPSVGEPIGLSPDLVSREYPLDRSLENSSEVLREWSQSVFALTLEAH